MSFPGRAKEVGAMDSVVRCAHFFVLLSAQAGLIDLFVLVEHGCK